MKSVSFLALALGAVGSPLVPRDAVTAIVDLNSKTGTPQHLASGIIYGTPDTLNQIPDHFYTDIDLKYYRAGGAQLGSPSRGWVWGLSEYKGRFQSTLNNYKTARKYGGTFQLLPHDIWGTDHVTSTTKWPGDNGDWASYDSFLNQLISDIKANNMQAGLQIDIWNEPELGIFWARTQQQWLDLYGRTHKRIRSDSALNSVQIVGPSLASQPYTSNSWWIAYLKYIVANNVAPDQYTWHLEGNPSDVNDDLQTNIGTFNTLRSTYGAPSKPININEYATFGEQVPSGAAWWISRLERYNAIGLRGNWLSGSDLHDYLASLLLKSGSTYYPNGEWQVYKYYAQSMTGQRVKTTGSTDRLFDVYATVGDKVRILSGTRVVTGTWAIQVNNLSAVGLPTAGNLTIQTWGFDDKGHSGRVDAPSNRGTYTHTYTGNTLTFPIFQTDVDKTTAWAFEFNVA